MAIKGVILAAGYGTRFLPVTKSLPKEMLPLLDRPAIDFVVQELIEAGIEDLLIISSRRKKVLEDWFDHDAELESVFRAEGANAKLAKVQPPKVRTHFVRQPTMDGAGAAILQARSFVGTDPFLLAYPDDLFGQPNCSAELVAVYQRTGCSVLSAMDLSGQDVSRYGVLDVDGDALRSIVEKPAAGSEPSHLVSLGRYLYTPEIFPLLDSYYARHKAEGRGEFFPTDAINALAAEDRVRACVVRAERHDTGTPLGYLQASIDEALGRPDLGPTLRDWLHRRLS